MNNTAIMRNETSIVFQHLYNENVEDEFFGGDMDIWLSDFVDNHIDGSLIRQLLEDEDFDLDPRYIAIDYEDLYAAVWVCLFRHMISQMIESLTLSSPIGERDTGYEVQQFLSDKDIDVEDMLRSKIDEAINSERLVCITLSEGVAVYINQIQNYIMKGV